MAQSYSSASAAKQTHMSRTKTHPHCRHTWIPTRASSSSSACSEITAPHQRLEHHQQLRLDCSRLHVCTISSGSRPLDVGPDTPSLVISLQREHISLQDFQRKQLERLESIVSIEAYHGVQVSKLIRIGITQPMPECGFAGASPRVQQHY